jgi:cephalosporin-C deacetylase
MPQFDLPLAKLKKYRPAEPAPRGFDAFWKKTLAQTAKHDLAARFERIADPIFKLVDAYDVTFCGFGGHQIKGWFIEPAGNRDRLPCIVSYVGYSGGRSLPTHHVLPVTAGFAHLVMDTRGQGSNAQSPGDTPDPVGSGPQISGFMTKGIDSPETYYYRRVFTDAVRAFEAAAAHPHVDPKRMAVTGPSQGGASTIAVAGLLGSRVKLAMPDVPFLCHFRRAVGLVDQRPYDEITNYLKSHHGMEKQVFHTLAYHDGIHFAARIKARCLFSVGLMDMTCPPSTVFAAYNRIKAPKKINIYPYNEHEGGGPLQVAERMRFAARYL